MNKLRDKVARSNFITKIDLKAGYYIIQIKSGNEWTTAFHMRYGYYEFLVMPFKLANAPAILQHMINNIL
jgi:hypothetical protein